MGVRRPTGISSFKTQVLLNTVSNLEIPADIDLESLRTILPNVLLTSLSPDSVVSLHLRRWNMHMPYRGSLRRLVPRAKERMWNSIRLCRIGRV